MKCAALQSLIAAGESPTPEIKTSFAKATVESMVAFANAQGRTVLVGVTDAAKVQGVTLGKETLNERLGKFKSATSPTLIPDIAAHTAQGKTVVAIRIGEFPAKPVNIRGRYFKHNASSNRCRFATKPLRHYIRISRFKTLRMFIDDRQLADTLFEVVDQSMKFIVSCISMAFEFDGRLQRKERFGYAPTKRIGQGLELAMACYFQNSNLSVI